jgi:hypothetical protein
MNRAWIALVIAAGCQSKERTVPAPEPPAPAPVVVAPAPPADASALVEHMREHFGAVAELERAIVRGHLDEARDQARWIADHPEPLQEGWQPFLDEVHAAAAEVATAKDLPAAGALAARLGRACASCHEARAAVVTFEWEPKPEDKPDLRSQMRLHQWGAARLWEGLVGPSDAMWTEGLSALQAANLDVPTAASGLPRGDVSALADKVKQLSTRALDLQDEKERAALYGELLSTCAGCHQLVRPKPVP